MAAHPSAMKSDIQSRECFAESCDRGIRESEFMCDYHWRLLTPELQMELFEAYRPGQIEDESMVTMIYLDVAMRCVSFVAMCERRRR